MSDVRHHLRAYQVAADLLLASEVEAAAELLVDARRDGRGVYICGNGGSAATASHLAVDLGKTLRVASGKRMRVVSLTDNVPWLTAVANDLSYEDCFAEQLRNYVEPSDLVIGISASGNSENVVRVFELARRHGAHCLAMVGFDGGRLARLATRRILVESFDYGIVESLHLAVAHILVSLLSEDGELSGVPQGSLAASSGHVQVCKSRDSKVVSPGQAPGVNESQGEEHLHQHVGRSQQGGSIHVPHG